MKYKNIVVGIIFKEKKIYISKGKKNKYILDLWEFPGGKVKKNENLICALKRELLEETGIQILKCRFFQSVKYL